MKARIMYKFNLLHAKPADPSSEVSPVIRVHLYVDSHLQCVSLLQKAA